VLKRSNIVRTVNVAWQSSSDKVDTNKRAIAALGWGPLNYIIIDHPEVPETKKRLQSISEIYAKQVKYGVEVTYLTSLNTEKGYVGVCMDIFLDHKFQENALGKLPGIRKKESLLHEGLFKNTVGDQIFRWHHGYHRRI
jgi:hypothetical protein